jgi:predicted DNA-binding ribbon-helix-helix protein
MASEGDVLPEAKPEAARRPARGLPGLASPWEQRILQLDGMRYSLRLEPEFWAALEAIASQRKLRLNRIVAEIASRRSGANNLSSLIRVFCLGEIERSTAGRSLALDSASIAALVEAAPAPGLLLDTDQLILAANGAFVRWSGVKRALLLRQKIATHFRLESASNFDGLWVRPLREEEAQVVSVMPDGVVTARAKLLPLLSARGRRLCVVWVIV